ncbi:MULTISPECIES: hypothetical protein [Cysteiniphilum]|uniref:Uncharacterized protein n=1 Tax=Cysteiniphilum litorale TaxID=2056700 RepID=A0A8J3E894_9GAMM|nr:MULTISPECIES: hypothetical protein [Cysteiniphilum]GGF91216.1 hypothetical protein GCM10010995_05640 [Cysteiniphilum litorale]
MINKILKIPILLVLVYFSIDGLLYTPLFFIAMIGNDFLSYLKISIKTEPLIFIYLIFGIFLYSKLIIFIVKKVKKMVAKNG